MEETKVLSDIIGDLLDRGYSLDFEELQQMRFNLGEQDIQVLSANEFVIDEVYCCGDDSPEVMYVFAVSSVRYRMKGIVINAITTDTSITLGEIFQKIKGAFLGLLKH
jgi:hypothetical protein